MGSCTNVSRFGFVYQGFFRKPADLSDQSSAGTGAAGAALDAPCAEAPIRFTDSYMDAC